MKKTLTLLLTLTILLTACTPTEQSSLPPSSTTQPVSTPTPSPTPPPTPTATPKATPTPTPIPLPTPTNYLLQANSSRAMLWVKNYNDTDEYEALYRQYILPLTYAKALDLSWEKPSDIAPDYWVQLYIYTPLQTALEQSVAAYPNAPEYTEPYLPTIPIDVLESFYRYEPNTVTVPASEVEAYVQSYADVTSEFLRRSKYYDSALKAYVFDYEQALSYYSNPPVAIVNVTELERNVHVFEMESRYQKAQEDSYTLTVEINSDDDFRYISNRADVHPHTENDPPKPIFDGFSQLEKFWINKTETFNLVMLDLSEPMDGRDTLFFFLYLIQDKDFYDRFRWILEDYTYGFPLADVEQIILEHLNLDSFDIETALEDWNRGGSPWGSFTYDSEHEILYRDYIGGYGGARSTEVIGYVKNGDEVSITLGLYNFGEGGEIRSLIPQSTFKVDYIITDDSWKVVRSVNEEYTVKHNEKFTKAYAVGNDSIGIDSAVCGLTVQNNLYICEMIDGEQSVTLYMSDVEDIELTEFGKVVPLKDGTAELTSYYDLPNFKTTTIKYENAKSIGFDAYITNDDTVRYYHDGEFHSLDIKAQKLISTGSSGLIILDNVGTLWAYSYKTGTYREVGTDVVDFDFFRGAVTHYGEIWYINSDGKLGLDHYYQ